MGFIDGLTRILQGKPPEEILPDEIMPGDALEDDPSQESQPEPEVEQPQPPQPPAIIQIVRTMCNPKGANVEVYGFLHNDSDVLIQVDKIRLFGGMRELN
ncbi:MAG: hypothetical protein ACMG55_17270, partial [Microcoleus sp.]